MKLLLSAVNALLLVFFAATNDQNLQVAAARTGASVCQLPLDTGNSCPTDQAASPSSFRRWYYDSETGKCATFSWTRCGGNENRFRSKTQCERRCVLATASNNEDSTKSGHDNQRPDDAHFANIKSRSPSRRCPPVKCGDDADSHQCPSGTSPVFSQNENGCPLCKCVPSASDSNDVAPSAPETTSLPPPSTTTTAEITCPPISCDEITCPGPILLRIDDETGCPVCQCTSSAAGNDATDTQHHRDVTTPSTSLPEAVVACPEQNCVCAGPRIVDPDTGCETCSCENSADETVEKPEDVSQHQQPIESSVDADADCTSRCDDQCREDGNVRDQSATCDVTACACVSDNENTAGDDHVHDAPASSSACPDRPVDCADFCGDDAVATSSVDEFGCDICTCSAVLSNSFTQIAEEDQAAPQLPLPSTDSVDCPEVDCGQLDCNELGGFAVDETTGCQQCACRESAVTDNTDDDEANRHVQCQPCADPTIVCSEGFEVDAATGCETCECRHQPVADQTLNDYGELVPAASLQCDPETECSGDGCVQAIDPQTGCHVCLCDDDQQQGAIGVDSDRAKSEWDEDNRIDPRNENPEPACPEVRCRQDCEVITDDSGCVTECRCTEVEEEPEVRPECPEHRCNCDSDDFETAWSVDENGCHTCSCIPRTRSAPRVHDDDRHHSTDDVNENEATERSSVDSEHHRRQVDPAVVSARKVLCSLAAEHGPCTADVTRFHYDPTGKSCNTFKYGGCRGNANNFRTEQDCRQYCEPEVNAQKIERRAWYKRILGFLRR